MSPLESVAQPRGATRGEAQARHEDFAAAPHSWYYLGHVSELRRPLRFELPNGQAYVAFRTAGGEFGVLNARCCHLGVDLARGCVVGERLACPLHGWEYGIDGRCGKIPAQSEIPAFARQASYPVTVRRGHVFFHNQPAAPFPLPFFDGVSPEQLEPARAFSLTTDAPWYAAEANGFDVHHFQCAHDRVLLAPPVLDTPGPFSQRMTVRLGVAGRSLGDRFTRLAAGSELTLSVVSWGGALVFVTAKFRRTTSYGLVTIQPLAEARTRVRVIVWAQRHRVRFLRPLLDPLSAWVRRTLIARFLASDIDGLAGLRYQPQRLLPIDASLAQHLAWLKQVQLAPAPA